MYDSKTKPLKTYVEASGLFPLTVLVWSEFKTSLIKGSLNSA